MSTSDRSSRLMLALLTALLFIAPIGQAYAQSRSFQMAMWAGFDAGPGVDTDIPVIYDTVGQPNGPAILIRTDLNKPLSAGEYDWSRIVAVLFDEPYNEFRDLPSACWTATMLANVNAREQVLAARAAELKSIAPSTRFWVNLNQEQLDWVRDPHCDPLYLRPVNVNRPYIDVISVDIYYTAFDPVVKGYYDWLDTHRAKPDQQVALIPGTFYVPGHASVTDQASRLYGYLNYANNANQNCDLPLGSRGRTGHFDGCRVWIVMGWLGPNFSENGWNYKGERDPTSAPIASVWQAQRAVPLRPDLAHQVTPAQLVPILVQPMLN